MSVVPSLIPSVLIAFQVSVIGSVVFYLLCYGAPRVMLRLNSMPWTFYFGRNLDLDFQSVTYAAYHTKRVNQIAHWPLPIDQISWFIVFFSLSPVIAAAAFGLLVLQAILMRDRPLTITIIVCWTIIAGVAFAIVQIAGQPWAQAGGMLFLLLSATARFVGHSAEPIPPMMSAESDQFIPMSQAKITPFLLMLPVFGYFSEFCAGLPFRLVIVQMSWITQRLGFKLQRAPSWKEACRFALAIHKFGWRAYRPTAELISRYVDISGAEEGAGSFAVTTNTK